MSRRSPWAHHYEQERAANARVLDIALSASHPCGCGHVQGFHYDTDDGKSLGKCVDADCPCTEFDEDIFLAAQLEAGLLPTTTVAAEKDSAEDDPLVRAMQAEEQREVDAEEAWDWAVYADRPRPTGAPRPSTRRDPAALDALRDLGGNPEDLKELGA